MTADRLAALKASDDPLKFWGNAEPKCPHCGTDFNIADHEEWRLYSENEHVVTCPSCDLYFTVVTNVTYTFSTDEQPDEDEA